MKKLILITSIIAFVFSSINAQDLISVKELGTKMKDKNCVVISAEKASKYTSKDHIKGSINVPYNLLEKTGAVEGLLKSPATLAALLGKKGVSNTNSIVVYDNGKAKYAGRLYWVLKYLGCKDVKILQGQLSSWKAARKPITKIPTNKSKKTFTASVNSSISANINQVKSGNFLVVDVRTADEFNGVKEGSLGHIPNAKYFNYAKVLNGSKIKSKGELLAAFKAAGITSDKKIILYCKTSVRAGIVFHALKTVCGYPSVKVYDGALNEWVTKYKAIKK